LIKVEPSKGSEGSTGSEAWLGIRSPRKVEFQKGSFEQVLFSFLLLVRLPALLERHLNMRLEKAALPSGEGRCMRGR